MNTLNVTWKEFRDLILTQIENREASKIYRGQCNSDWKLRTAYHRINQPIGITFKTYFYKLIPYIADIVGTLENREINVSDPISMGAFLAFIQHNGFPTPLLDFTLSPYKAAYYAFAGVENGSPQIDKVSIYAFANESWTKTFDQVGDYDSAEAHVSVLLPKTKGNHRQISQQGAYLFTNVDEVEAHIISCEKGSNSNFLTKYNFSIREKPKVMKDLENMGINAYSLFGGTEGMLRFYKESLFQPLEMGETQTDLITRVLENLNRQTPSRKINGYLDQITKKT